MPGKDIHDRVCPCDEVKLDVIGIARAQLAEGIDCIGDAGAIDLEAAGVERRVRGSGQHRHGVAILGVAHVLVLLERGRTGGHEQHQIKIERLACLLGGDQVAVVEEAIIYLQHRMARMGVDDALIKAGCKNGDEVRILGYAFDFEGVDDDEDYEDDVEFIEFDVDDEGFATEDSQSEVGEEDPDVLA